MGFDRLVEFELSVLFSSVVRWVANRYGNLTDGDLDGPPEALLELLRLEASSPVTSPKTITNPPKTPHCSTTNPIKNNYKP